MIGKGAWVQDKVNIDGGFAISTQSRERERL
jgi:hypothetical protein